MRLKLYHTLSTMVCDRNVYDHKINNPTFSAPVKVGFDIVCRFDFIELIILTIETEVVLMHEYKRKGLVID